MRSSSHAPFRRRLPCSLHTGRPAVSHASQTVSPLEGGLVIKRAIKVRNREQPWEKRRSGEAEGRGTLGNPGRWRAWGVHIKLGNFPFTLPHELADGQRREATRTW